MQEAHHRRLAQLFEGSPINRTFRAWAEVSDGTATVRMVVRPDLHHPGGAAHGAVLFKLLDDAAFLAASSRFLDQALVTSDFAVHLVGMVVEGPVRAEGRVEWSSRRQAVASARLEDERGRLLALGRGTFQATGAPLPGPTC